VKRFAKLVLSLCLLSLGLPAGVARGDDPLKKSEGSVENSKPSGTTLTDESLKTLLERMGYEFEPIKSTSGLTMYRVKFEQSNWTYTMYVSLSGDKSMVWLATPLIELPAGDKVPEAILEKLLQKTDELGPCHFSLKGRRVYLNLPLENRNITPARLRQALDTMATNVKETAPYWTVEKWPEVINKDVPKTEAARKN
jgi:hypothetical protein